MVLMMNNTTNIDTNAAFNSEWKRTNHYAYLSGELQGLLKYWINAGIVPGVSITDRVAYDAWVEKAIAQSKASAEKFAPL